MIKKITLLIVVVLFLFVQQANSQEWLVPADKQNVENPSEYNLENVKKGKDLYMTNCKSCHGDAGKNNPLALVPLPPDVASEAMHKNSEGSLYYKISAGKGLMPAFESTLSENDRWLLVNYIMNYSPKNTPVWVDAPPIKAKISALLDNDNSKIEISAEYEDKSGNYNKLSEVLVIISVKKMFGNLEMGQAVTNENGMAVYSIPENCVGDEEGFIDFVISLSEKYEAENVVLENSEVEKCEPIQKLIKPGVIWSTNKNIPMWMLLSYIGMVGGAWLTIFYVVFQIIKIRKFSRE